ncbi:MAG: hypothetical protein IKG75_00120 [Bacteroidaceae bacterium]|nr:hypothetical protein [Bacteroidaceae bacterium]
MKRPLLIALFCLLAATAVAQTSIDDYRARFTEVNRAYAQHPSDVEALYNMAVFYFDNSHPMRNLPVAMDYIRRAEAEHINLLENNKIKRLTQLGKIGIDLTSLRQLKQAIAEAAANTVKNRADMSAAEIDAYLEAFGDDKEVARQLRQRRLRQVYNEDLAAGTPEAYHHFIVTYPGTGEAEQMEERLRQLAPSLCAPLATDQALDSLAARYPQSPSIATAVERRHAALAYARAKRSGTVEAYNDFLSRYPASDDSPRARQELDLLLDADFSSRTTALELAHFADSNADSPLAERALAQLRRLIYDNHDVEAARYYVSHFKLDPHVSEVYSRYYSWCAAEGNTAPLAAFKERHPDFPFPRALADDIDAADYFDTIPLLSPFREERYDDYAYCIRSLAGRGLSLVVLQRTLQPLLDKRNYIGALDRARQFDMSFGNQWIVRYNELLRLLMAAPNPARNLRHEPLDSTVTRPVVHPVDGRLYFTRVTPEGNLLCTTTDTIRFSNTAATDLTLFGFYADGTRMLLGSGGDIWIAERDEEPDTWRISDLPPYPVNTDYIETDAYMLPDGSGMLLASDRPGGHNLQPSGAWFHGDTALATDLWFIPYTRSGWGDAVNLGIGLNTPYCERSPILSRNLRTLYFISDGYGGLGYGDVYVAQRTGASWAEWSTPQNVGREINSPYRERSISFSPDEHRIFLDNTSSISSFATWHNTAGSYADCRLDVAALQDKLFRVTVADLDRQAVTQTIDYAGTQPAVTLTVGRAARCVVFGDAGDLFVPAVLLGADSTTVLLRGYTLSELVSVERDLPLHAVEFAAGTTDLLPVARLQLEQLARFLVRQPEAVVEFGVNVPGTDARRCYDLSLQRAEALRVFLAERGVDPSRVLLSPYGNVQTGPRGAAMVTVRFR